MFIKYTDYRLTHNTEIMQRINSIMPFKALCFHYITGICRDCCFAEFFSRCYGSDVCFPKQTFCFVPVKSLCFRIFIFNEISDSLGEEDLCTVFTSTRRVFSTNSCRGLNSVLRLKTRFFCVHILKALTLKTIGLRVITVFSLKWQSNMQTNSLLC